MKRSGFLRRLTRLKRKKPLKKKRKRGSARETEWFRAYGSVHRVLWVHANGCEVARLHGTYGCYGRIECAHVTSRGAHGSWRDCVGLCQGHHSEQHNTGILTFQRKYGLDLEKRAFELCRQYQAAFPEKSKELAA